MRSSSNASAPESRQTSLAKFAAVNSSRFDELRKLLWIHLPHGATREIAEVLGCQESHVSRQFSGERRLTEEVATYALHLIKQLSGTKEVVNRVRELRDVVDLEARIRIALTLYPDGRCEWEHIR